MRQTFQRILSLILLLALIAGVLWAATGDESAALTFLHKPRTHNTVWDAIVTASHDADDTGDVTQEITVNGIIQKVMFTVPTFTNGSETGQVVIKDNEGGKIFDSGEQPDAAADPYAFSLHEPVTGTISVIIGPSGATGNAVEMTVVLRGI